MNRQRPIHAGGDAKVRALLGAMPLATVALVVATALAQRFADVLQYARPAATAGGWHRLLSGHFVHWSGEHLLWDALAFAILGAVVERVSRRAFFATVAASAVAVGVAVHAWAPGMEFYRGLSGIDCALFGFAVVRVVAVATAQRRWGVAAGALALVAAFLAKTMLERSSGQALFVRSGDAFVAVPLAHLVGAAVGAAIAILHAWDVRGEKKHRTVASGASISLGCGVGDQRP